MARPGIGRRPRPTLVFAGEAQEPTLIGGNRLKAIKISCRSARSHPPPLPRAVNVAVKAVKVRNWIAISFARCRLAAFDPRAVAALNRPESEYLALAAERIDGGMRRRSPVFRSRKSPRTKPLPLVPEGVNPAWAAPLGDLAISPPSNLCWGDKNSLTEADWNALLTTARLAPFEAWSAGKVGASVEKLGLKAGAGNSGRLRAGGYQRSHYQRQETLEAEGPTLHSRMWRSWRAFNRDLYTLCVNFCQLSKNFYSRKDAFPAVFQAGRIVSGPAQVAISVYTVEDSPAGTRRIWLASPVHISRIAIVCARPRAKPIEHRGDFCTG